jgi:hypothetical protein
MSEFFGERAVDIFRDKMPFPVGKLEDLFDEI